MFDEFDIMSAEARRKELVNEAIVARSILKADTTPSYSKQLAREAKATIEHAARFMSVFMHAIGSLLASPNRIVRSR